MRVHPIPDDALGNVAYLVDVGGELAVSIDPRRDVAEHLEIAEAHGLTIAAVLETHLHADFVSGARELAAATGSEILAAADGRLSFPHRPLRPSERLTLGGTSVEVVATPGHTPEHLSFVLSDGTADALFSGGSLLAGGAGRTDLTGSGRTTELSRAQFGSLRRLAALRDDTALHPTHAGGSFCSTGARGTGAGTIGEARKANPLFVETREDAFVEALLAGFGSYPPYFAHLRDLNRKGVPLLDTFAALSRLEASDVRAEIDRGAWMIDARPWKDWARAFAEGSVSIELRPAFASWLGWVVPFGAPVVFVLDPDRVDEATRLARRIGYDRLSGWIPFDALREAGFAITSMETVGPVEAADRSRAGDATLLDVRQRSEYSSVRLPGAVHIELGDLIAGKTPEASAVITYCGHGERSATAASLLARRGVRVANLAGGVSAWRDAGLPVER